MRRIAIVAGLLGALGVAVPAEAAITCSYGGPGQILAVTMSASEAMNLSVVGGNVVVASNAMTPIPCTGQPVPVNQANRVVVTNSPGGHVATVTIHDPEAFAPGNDEGIANPGELEIEVNLGDGPDVLQLRGSESRNVWIWGSGGLNWNSEAEGPGFFEDLDVLPSGADTISSTGNGGNDFLTGQGGSGTGNEALQASFFHLTGGSGDDELFGTSAGQILKGEGGEDLIQGFAGNDDIEAGADDDVVDAGPGTDRLTSPITDADQTIDLATSGAQDTGLGVDTLSNFENVAGSDGDDVLRGSGGPNLLQGGKGNDLLEGRAGNDEIDDGDGSDTASFESASVGVVVDLRIIVPQVTGAGEDDISAENLLGSAFADNLTGDDEANVLTGAAGADRISALAGDDRLELRDATGDDAACGEGSDTVNADPAGVDTLAGDCEIANFLPDVIVPDVIAPVFTGRVRASPARFRARRGTRFVYSLSEAATVTFAFQRRAAGRRVGGRCRKPNRRNRGRRRCTRFVAVGRLLAAAQPGANSTRFNGVVGGRRLGAGRYRVLLTAVDEVGNASAPASASFRVLKPKPRRRARA